MSKRPRHVMVFDPGQTIGVAVLKRGGDVVITRSIETDGTIGWRRCLEKLFSSYASSSELVIEKGPDFGRHNRGILTMVERELVWLGEQHDMPAVWIRPAEWKGHPAARLSDIAARGGLAISKHERDAIGMGRVWIHLSKGKKDD